MAKFRLPQPVIKTEELHPLLRYLVDILVPQDVQSQVQGMAQPIQLPMPAITTPVRQGYQTFVRALGNVGRKDVNELVNLLSGQQGQFRTVPGTRNLGEIGVRPSQIMGDVRTSLPHEKMHATIHEKAPTMMRAYPREQVFPGTATAPSGRPIGTLSPDVHARVLVQEALASMAESPGTLSESGRQSLMYYAQKHFKILEAMGYKTREQFINHVSVDPHGAIDGLLTNSVVPKKVREQLLSIPEVQKAMGPRLPLAGQTANIMGATPTSKITPSEVLQQMLDEVVTANKGRLKKPASNLSERLREALMPPEP